MKLNFAKVRPGLRVHCLCLAMAIAGSDTEALARSPGQGAYTPEQAASGAVVYRDHCAQCHGAELEGKIGGPLIGRPFADSLEFSKLSAKQLFAFISLRMPGDRPGSLKDIQYLRVLAYLLSENGFRSGDQPLTAQSLGRLQLLPVPEVAEKAHSVGR